MKTIIRILGQFAMFFLGGAPGVPKEERRFKSDDTKEA